MNWRRSKQPRDGMWQRKLPQIERSERFERTARRLILVLTIAVAAGVLIATPLGRYTVLTAVVRMQRTVLQPFHRAPNRSTVDALWALQRARGIKETAARYTQVFHESRPALQKLLHVAGMAPDEGLFRWANFDRTLLFSSRIFAPDDSGRSYRLRPNTQGVWLREQGLVRSPFGMLLVPDTPEVRAAADEAGVLVVAGSEQTTNSWGLRGAEPRLDAAVRVMVLGDSFMQGLFVGDRETPPAMLESVLERSLGTSVCVLNTGHFGYSPEQYEATLRAFAPRFRPHAVIVSVCPNDFGDGLAVLAGKGDWSEAVYWLGAIQRFCREQGIACVVAPVPVDTRVEGQRLAGSYPGLIANACGLDSRAYCNPIEDFVDEHIRLVGESRQKGVVPTHGPLYNRHIDDGHFSALGSAVWGRALARRVSLLLTSEPPPSLSASGVALSAPSIARQ